MATTVADVAGGVRSCVASLARWSAAGSKTVKPVSAEPVICGACCLLLLLELQVRPRRGTRELVEFARCRESMDRMWSSGMRPM